MDTNAMDAAVKQVQKAATADWVAWVGDKPGRFQRWPEFTRCEAAIRAEIKAAYEAGRRDVLRRSAFYPLKTNAELLAEATPEEAK